jgi:hypothetical protein
MKHSRPKFLKLALAASMLLWASIAVTPAQAAPVTFFFEGVVAHTDVQLFSHASDPASPLGFNTRHPMNAFFPDESTTADARPGNVNFGQYEGALTDLSVTITGPPLLPSYTVALGDPAGSLIRVQDGVANDQYQVDAPVTGGDIKTLTPTQFNIDLTDAFALIFGDDSLPTTPPSLGDISTNIWRLSFDNGNREVRGSLTSLTAVPLPPAVILFGAGLVALIGLGDGSCRLQKTHTA